MKKNKNIYLIFDKCVYYENNYCIITKTNNYLNYSYKEYDNYKYTCLYTNTFIINFISFVIESSFK